MEDKNEKFLIGGVEVLLYLNSSTINLLKSKGVEAIEAVPALMAKNRGSENDLQVSWRSVTLNPIIKVWCQTTPIYKDNLGGVCVLFEQLDKETIEKEKLEFLGMINPEKYAASLCAKFGIKGREVYV
jgi:hypothetical protein